MDIEELQEEHLAYIKWYENWFWSLSFEPEKNWKPRPFSDWLCNKKVWSTTKKDWVGQQAE